MTTELEAAPAATPETRTPAQQAFDRWMAKWEGPLNLEEAHAKSEFYLEIAGFMLGALNDQIAELRTEKASAELVRRLFDSNARLSAGLKAMEDDLSDLRESVRCWPPSTAHGQAMARLEEHVQEQYVAIAKLLTMPALGATQTEPTIRIRRNYSPPTKDRGWNCEHTVESEYPLDDIDAAQIAAHDAMVYGLVERECIRRDELEGRTRRHFA